MVSYICQVISKGRNGFIGVGFSSADVKLDRLPGWEPHSFGYHGDDGNAFHESGKGIKYGPTFGTGAVLLPFRSLCLQGFQTVYLSCSIKTLLLIIPCHVTDV